MHEKTKKTTKEPDADTRLRKFFEEQRAYYKAWADDWDKKIAAGCNLDFELDSDGRAIGEEPDSPDDEMKVF